MTTKRYAVRMGLLGLSCVLAVLPMARLQAADPSSGPPTERIVGGRPTKISAHPHQVVLFDPVLASVTSVKESFSCGGTIVGSEWVITAAHCASGLDPSRIAVAVGVTDLRRPQEGRLFNVDRIEIHPGYDPGSNENDIALLHLTEPINFGGDGYTAKPMRLLTPEQAEQGATSAGRMATITGWGARSGSGRPLYPNALQEAFVPITTSSRYDPGVISPDNMIMAGYPAGGVDTCFGDSGGPLLVRVDDGTFRLAGVTSGGKGCADPGFPGVYSRVTAHASWLGQFVPSQDLFVDSSFTGKISVGSLSAPFRTLAEALGNAQPNAAIHVRGGGLYETPQLGSSVPVRITAYGSGNVQIRGTGQSPLVVNAGPDRIVPTDEAIKLVATADTGGVTLPLKWAWELVSGPGEIVAEHRDRAELDFFVTRSGSYVLRARASHAGLADEDLVTVTFEQETFRVDAGRDVGNLHSPPSSATLAGVVLVDGSPSAEVSVRWTLSAGPKKGRADIVSPTALSTRVTVDTPGVYSFALRAWYRGRTLRDVVRLGFGVDLGGAPTSNPRSSQGLPPPVAVSVSPLGNESIAITLRAAGEHPGPYVLQSSTDLLHWTDDQIVSLSEGSATVVQSTRGAEPARFFRATAFPSPEPEP